MRDFKWVEDAFFFKGAGVFADVTADAFVGVAFDVLVDGV